MKKADDFKEALVAEIPNLRAFAASLSGSTTLADDLVQDTLLRAWVNSDKFQPGTHLRAWLFTILRNAFYSHYRRRAREVEDVDGIYSGSLSVVGEQETHLDLADFRLALAKLPAEQREVLTMIGASGLSYEEAAEVCGVAIGTIKSRLNRARTRLAELLSLDARPDSKEAPTSLAVGRTQRAGRR
jgi:RNA polymerase sigma-70 factor, ECF subfamily